MTEEQKEPIAASVSSRSSTAYPDRPVGVYLVLETPRQKGIICKVEWFLSTGGASFEPLAEGAGLIVSHTPKAAGDLTFKARIFNKYIPQNIYETAPFTLPVDGGDKKGRPVSERSLAAFFVAPEQPGIY